MRQNFFNESLAKTEAAEPQKSAFVRYLSLDSCAFNISSRFAPPFSVLSEPSNGSNESLIPAHQMITVVDAPRDDAPTSLNFDYFEPRKNPIDTSSSVFYSPLSDASPVDNTTPYQPQLVSYHDNGCQDE